MKRAHAKKPENSNLPEEGAADRIKRAATELFAKKGYDATSTKEICEAADVNIAAIHYHFDSKENLFHQILDSLSSERLASAQRILQPVTTGEELKIRLHIFLSESLDTCLRQTSVCKIVQHEMENVASRSEEVFKKTFLKLYETLHDFLQDAQSKKLIAESVHPKIAAKVLFSQLADAVRREVVNKKFFGMSFDDDAFKKLWIDQTIGIFLGGVQTRVEKNI